jgi:2-amino-4-hydroxy-6-hydroxymethyldihydropteridine diphosphokinase
MAEVIIAAGSNLGAREEYLKKAGDFLEQLSADSIRKSSVWESEPVGPAKHTFLNAVCIIETDKTAPKLLSELKQFELTLGRDPDAKKWGPRILDLDIITYNSLVIQLESLIIPHPEYHRRLFVLLPLQELLPGWEDPRTGTGIQKMIDEAPGLVIEKTEHVW